MTENKDYARKEFTVENILKMEISNLDELLELFEEAQQKSDELSKIYQEIKNFSPKANLLEEK